MTVCSRAELARRLGEALLDVLEQAMTCSIAEALPREAASPQSASAPLELLRIDEVERRIGLKRTSVEALVARGVFTATRQGRAVRIPNHEVAAYQRRLITDAGGEMPGEQATPIDTRRTRRKRPVSARPRPHD